MLIEIKKYKFKCDSCGKEQGVKGVFDLPRGWTEIQVGPLGFDNDYENQSMCPKCVKKMKSKKEPFRIIE